MKKLIIVTVILAVISVVTAFVKFEENCSFNIEKINEHQIKKIESEIEEKKLILSKLEEDEKTIIETNKETVGILDVWKNMLTDLKKDI